MEGMRERSLIAHILERLNIRLEVFMMRTYKTTKLLSCTHSHVEDEMSSLTRLKFCSIIQKLEKR